jgi:hypothetical protein
MASPITPEHIQTFASAWFHAIDVHAPLQECLAMLAEDGLQMRFPDGDIRDFAVEKWGCV